MSDRKCICNHWMDKEHTINFSLFGPVRMICSVCSCQLGSLPDAGNNRRPAGNQL